MTSRVLFAVGALGFSCVITQLALMRELMAAFGGNEMVLGVALGLWLLLMGLGAWLGRLTEKLRRPLAALPMLQILIAVLPLAQVLALRALRNVVFVRGAAVGMTETVAATLVLLLPYCLAAGCALTMACSLLSRGEGPIGIGRGYVADSIGSFLGGILFSFVLVRSLDHLAILAYPALLNLLAVVAQTYPGSAGTPYGEVQRPSASAASELKPSWPLTALAAALGLGLLAAFTLADLDTLSTALQYSPQHVLSHPNSPYGKLLVTEADGQFNFLENGLPFTSTRDDQHTEETVHYTMAQRPEARSVLLIGGGISGTARELLKYPVRQVDYVELDPLILELGRKYLPDSMADARIRVFNTDGRIFLKHTTERYEVVILDLPAPATAQINRFYTAEFFAELKPVLTRDAVVSFSLGHYENYVSSELAPLLASACLSLKQSFTHVIPVSGGGVYFLGSDGPLFPDIASRLEQHRIKTRLVNHHYLDAMLTPDRLADIHRAVSQPAALNRDLNPVLYYYHLRHWLSQFGSGFGPLPIALLLLPGFYVIRLRRGALVLFASGFAASSLELVLLLAFQVLCGSVYHQVGLIVTVFMAGLALGAWGDSIICRGRREESLNDPHNLNRGLDRSLYPTNRFSIKAAIKAASTASSAPACANVTDFADRKTLSLLAFLLALYALCLPVLLPGLSRLGGAPASLSLIKTLVALLALLLAALVGMQFPLANRLEFTGTTSSVSRLYAADFVGASLGALLASVLLIPLLGVTGVCLLTALVNLLAGAANLRR